MKIQVDPELLDGVGKNIKTQVDNFKTSYGVLTGCFKVMSEWTGEDNTAYLEKVTKFKSDFDKLGIILEDFSKFLTDSATTYRNTIDGITSKAKALQD
jgi:uncharacterized protein YukE